MSALRLCVQTLRLGHARLGHKVLSAAKTATIINPGFCALVKRSFSNMCEEALAQFPDVDIDGEGTFKYILIKVYAKEVGGKEPSKMIVRGYKSCEYHCYQQLDSEYKAAV